MQSLPCLSFGSLLTKADRKTDTAVPCTADRTTSAVSVPPSPSRRSLASQPTAPPRALGGDSFGEGNEEEEPLGTPPLHKQKHASYTS